MKQYTPKKFTQEQITRVLLNVDGLPQGVNSLHQLRPIIWKNPLNKNSLHLSHAGWLICNKLKMHMYKFEFGGICTPKQLLQLEKYLCGPYHVYFKGTRLAVLEESDAMMFQLHQDNIGQYLDNLAKFS